MNFHFANLYGVQKYPVMNKSDIERKCQDKIPPDDAGMRQAENIKLVKAHGNVTTSEHPCSEPDIAATFIQKARELAEYWKLQAMDLDTSTGAAFQTIFPGKSKKNHVIRDRGEGKGEAGVWLKSALKEQWEHWKMGEVWVMPGSYSLTAVFTARKGMEEVPC